MVRLVQGVACCAPIGMQHATTAHGVQQPVQHGVQQATGFPYDSAAPAVQHPMQQPCNRGATAGAAKGVRVLRPITSNAPAIRWGVAYPNGAGMEVLFTPAATQADVAELYPGASIEPLPDAPMRTATPGEAGELHALIAAVLADDTDADRAEALAVALNDPDAALVCWRSLAKAPSNDEAPR